MIGTKLELMRLPGVLDVRPATPVAGCVTLVVQEGARGIKGYLDPGDGDGTGMLPINMRLEVVVAETGLPEPQTTAGERADLRGVLTWYREHNWPCIVGSRNWLPTASGEVVELGEGYVVLDNRSSRMNVPLRNVVRVTPEHGCPAEAPWWEVTQ